MKIISNHSIKLIVLSLFCAAMPGCNAKVERQSLPADPVNSAGEVRAPHRVELRHPGIKGNALQDYELDQVKTREGVVVGYALSVDSVVCEGGDCQVVDVHMNWDAIGEFTGYTLDADKYLEKMPPVKGKVWEPGTPTKALPFTDADYDKLDRILGDKDSLLRDRMISDLSARAGEAEVDAVTMATPATLRRAVVEGAALTCYHLWHWAHGEVGAAARDLTHRSCNKALLQAFLVSDKTHYVRFALKHLAIHNIIDPVLTGKAGEILRGGDGEQMPLAFTYLEKSFADKGRFTETVGNLFADCSSAQRIRLIGIVADREDLPDALLEEMGHCLPEMDSYYEVHLFLQLLEQRNYRSESLLKRTAMLLRHDNFFIARRAYWYLQKQQVSEKTAERMRVFREKSEDDGRILLEN